MADKHQTSIVNNRRVYAEVTKTGEIGAVWRNRGDAERVCNGSGMRVVDMLTYDEALEMVSAALIKQRQDLVAAAMSETTFPDLLLRAAAEFIREKLLFKLKGG